MCRVATVPGAIVYCINRSNLHCCRLVWTSSRQVGLRPHLFLWESSLAEVSDICQLTLSSLWHNWQVCWQALHTQMDSKTSFKHLLITPQLAYAAPAPQQSMQGWPNFQIQYRLTNRPDFRDMQSAICPDDVLKIWGHVLHPPGRSLGWNHGIEYEHRLLARATRSLAPEYLLSPTNR